jgi:hypothetical protein
MQRMQNQQNSPPNEEQNQTRDVDNPNRQNLNPLRRRRRF